MYRSIIDKLISWKNSPSRKPLILNGARQVGKTYILQKFGSEHYEQTAYVNLDHNEEVSHIFEQDYDISRILRSLSSLLHIHIEPGNTLIIFDEVQENPFVLNSLKYFCENAPEFHVAVAGSLLGISLHGGMSFPVGKVDMIKMHPMTFPEFLMAIGEGSLAETLEAGDWSVINSLAVRFTDCLRQYYYVGGMPAVVKEYATTGNLQTVRQIQQQILFDYRRDFSKHVPIHLVPRINMVWDSIPAQLAKENKKFVYGVLKQGGRAAEFELAIQWLIDAGLVYRIYRATTPAKPLKFYEDMSAFKLFMLDVGLMGAMTDTESQEILVHDTLLREYKGAFTELYVLTQLMPFDIPVYYHSSNVSRIEIDFLIQAMGRVIPVEVKAEVNVKSKSLRTFIDKHPSLRALRLSMQPYRQEEWMDNVPLYAIQTSFSRTISRLGQTSTLDGSRSSE